MLSFYKQVFGAMDLWFFNKITIKGLLMKTFKYHHLPKKITVAGLFIVALLFYLLLVPFTACAENETGADAADISGTALSYSPSPVPTPAPTFETEALIGIIDLTAGYIEPVTDDEFNGQFYVDGRVAFYLKGKIKGKYLLTAQIDTGEEPLSQLFSGLDYRESIFSKIDPEKYYPVYGDDSTCIDDVDSRGKVYVRLEWNQSKVLLGNYQVIMNNADLAKYSRSLYGLDAEFKNVADVKKHAGTQIFWAKPFTVHSHDIIKATGGALYYLKHADVVIGSEQAAVEIRDSISGAVIESITLQSARDYELDYAQGRLILTRSLEAIVSSGLITVTHPLDGNTFYLIIDYEYEGDATVDNPSYGLRTGYLPGDRLKLGGSLVKETTGAGQDYTLWGIDLQYQLTPNIKLTGEEASSEQSIGNRFYSEDGGLTYHQFDDTIDTDSHRAWKIGLDADLTRFFNFLNDFKLQTYAVVREQGFSTTECQTVNDYHEYDLRFSGTLNNGSELLFIGDIANETDVKQSVETVLQLGTEFGSFKLTEELRYQNCLDLAADREFINTLGAVRLDYPWTDNFNIYGSQQATLIHNEETPVNNRTALGAEWSVNPKTTLNFEGSKGDQGDSALVGLKYQWNESSQTYGKMQYNTDTQSGYTMITTVGDKSELGERTDCFAERRIAGGSYENGVANVFGLDYNLGRDWLLSFDYTLSNVDVFAEPPSTYNPFTGEPETKGLGWVNRRIIGAGIVRRTGRIEYKTGLQVCYDETDTLNSRRYLMTNSFKHKLNNEFSYFAGLNYSLTQDQDNGAELAHFVEEDLGLAYRPVENDRLNLLAKYTYHQELSPSGQLGGNLPEECYHVLAVEGIRKLGARWELGEKLAYKRTGVQTGPVLHDWQTNDLFLWINRLNYHLPFHWEASAEYRILRDIDAEDQRSGYLLAIYYLFQSKARVGAGYNFTNFSDDLVHFNENAGGWFVNLVFDW